MTQDKQMQTVITVRVHGGGFLFDILVKFQMIDPLHSNLAEAIKQTLKNPKCQIMAREDAPTSIEKEQASTKTQTELRI